MAKLILEQNFSKDIATEEDGKARISNVTGQGEVYVAVVSWDETKQHVDFSQFENKNIRITIETIE